MADDNVMNLRNRIVPRNSGNNQASNSENAVERQAVLSVKVETSGQSDQQEPSLAQALGQMMRVLQVLDQNSHKSTARLDAVQFRKGNNEDRPRWSRNKDWNKEKEKNISFVEESSAQDEPNTSDETKDSADETEIYAAEMVKNHQPYKCALLRPAKTSEAKARVAAYTYSFDVSKNDLIFDRLLKDERIQLQEVNMVDIKGKAPADRKTEDDVAYTKRTLRLCIRCKAEMTRRDWEAIIHEKKLYGEWKEFMAFSEEWANIPEAEKSSEDGSEESSNDSEQEVDSVKDKRDLVMQKVLNDYYSRRNEDRNSRMSYPEKLFDSQQRSPGYRPNWQHQARARPEPKFEGMTEGDIEFLDRRLVNELGRVMIDGGTMVNVIPTSFFKKLGKSEDELKPTNTIMTDFTGSGQQQEASLRPSSR
uniref:Uncharacterized protein n=1 Tax=Ananas comosus var. bracteatus TaxID=296719 RepID=A0A6V7QBY3_ANACO|nr:unnamed protein product [Ananas comosus var. bracteatus]